VLNRGWKKEEEVFFSLPVFEICEMLDIVDKTIRKKKKIGRNSNTMSHIPSQNIIYFFSWIYWCPVRKSTANTNTSTL